MSEQSVKLGWSFLTTEIEDDALLLDCRSEEAFAGATIRGAYSAASIRKAHGSGPNSMLKLSGLVKSIQNLTEGKRSVTVFDEGMGMFAGKMAWVLKSAGMKDVAILGRRFTDLDSSDLVPGKEVLLEQELKSPIILRGIVPISHVQMNLTRVQLVDVRSPEEYDGILPRLVTPPEPGSRCGRIPGSVNYDWRLIYDETGYIRSRVELGREFHAAGLIPERPTILYDFNGARSSMMAFLFQECGYRHVEVFLGSWMEWRKTRLPAQKARIWNP